MGDLYAILPQLSSVNILHTELHQLPPITPELTSLCLKDCNLTYLPEDFLSGSLLTTIELSNNRLTEVPNLRSIQDTITFIDLSNNSINDINMLKLNFKDLIKLLLSNNLIRSFMMPRSYFWPKLNYLSLSNNKIINFDMPIHYLNIQIDLTGNQLRCSYVTTLIQDCQSGENSELPRLYCPRHVTLIGFTCYPGTRTSTRCHSVLISADLSLLMATLSVSINGW